MRDHPIWLTLGAALAALGGGIVAAKVAEPGIHIWESRWFLLGLSVMLLGLVVLVGVATNVLWTQLRGGEEAYRQLLFMGAKHLNLQNDAGELTAMDVGITIANRSTKRPLSYLVEPARWRLQIAGQDNPNVHFANVDGDLPPGTGTDFWYPRFFGVDFTNRTMDGEMEFSILYGSKKTRLRRRLYVKLYVNFLWSPGALGPVGLQTKTLESSDGAVKKMGPLWKGR